MLQFFLVLVLLTTRWSLNFGHVAGPVYRAVINPSPPGWGICEAEDKNRCVCLTLVPMGSLGHTIQDIHTMNNPCSRRVCDFLKGFRFVLSRNIHEPLRAKGYSGPHEVLLAFN